MSTPAKVSGPGPYSQRTDQGAPKQPLRDIPNADYGEQAAYQAQQTGAPMAAQKGVPPHMDVTGMNFGDLFGNPGDRVTPIHADSTQPNTPVTDGAAAGPGAGTAALGLANRSQQDMQNMASQLPVIEWMANQPNASWGLRQLVRTIKGSM